ncbi:CheR family methyltransferase [Massilia sp.]|uniref:CheR family methyltransferase n=1 Tax=Massilia sp. TaxID=1882437 RepID=UPI0028B1B6F0|nr:CheR family methyltransferase [Massilia sp.]
MAALNAPVLSSSFAADPAVEELEIALLLDALYQRHGHDFRDYDRALVRRTLCAVMAERGLKTVSSLQERVLHESGAAAGVLRALAGPPSDLFDDPPRAREARELLGKSLRSAAVPRVWLAECAGAGQAWTLAILLHEEGVLARTEIFATVANEELLAGMRAASLDADTLPVLEQHYREGGGSGRLADYFDVGGGRAVLLPQLRGRITWAGHNLVTDASFNEFQAIVCCRDLRDFGPMLRQRALRLFHDSLARFGVLGIACALGPGDAIAGDYQLLGYPGWYKRVA